MIDLAALDWSAPSTIDTTHVHHGYRQITIVAGGQVARPDLAGLVAGFDSVWDAWLSWIDPGGYIVAHVDAGPHHERWQVPLDPPGDPYLVEHWHPHEVHNTSDRPRIRLVVDLDRIVQPVSTRFRTTTEPAEILR